MRWVFADLVAHVALASPAATAAGTKEVHIREDKLFVQLGEKNRDGFTRWILNTGAMNHMTGERSAFSDLDTSVHGTVRFGDGSVVGIEGRAHDPLHLQDRRASEAAWSVPHPQAHGQHYQP